ncbi:MAG: amino acid permease [Cyanobacteria bacterium QH_8_48_120]|nr:MAG: amino acid permease [Cyanobacteria bacterium QH_1_48_107]PSO66359.1 MAG: amino acid permease [Cyanobacteria bacterium QH_6_48_35]PSO76116.1 MAG: amino acid permease [Cyanobacteria bacterium QH_8_48_120]
MADQTSPQQLKRELGVFGAAMMGMGSIVGTGVFVSIGIAAGVAGAAVILAVAMGALVATCNGLSSAQLAANHPVSGGTYEYGYQYLNPWLGFTAGWMFLLAKTASAATAALGFSSYLLNALGLSDRGLHIPFALAAVVLFTILVLTGIRRSNRTNIAIVSITLLSLLFFVAAGLPVVVSNGANHLTPSFEDVSNPVARVLQASALMFVAYTGYGRIATLGEEVRKPRQTIPKAMIVTMVVIMLLYMAVAVVGIGAVGAESLSAATGEAAAPLVVAARNFGVPGSSQVLAVGAITAMLGVLLNLILGLSRVLLAMARRKDMPGSMARLNQARTPSSAVLLVGMAIACFVLIGNVKTTWSFSAFTVLIYYALTNLSALRLPEEGRLYPRWVAWIGLGNSLFLAFWVEQPIWLVGLGLILGGLIWRTVFQVVVARLRQH